MPPKLLKTIIIVLALVSIILTGYNIWKYYTVQLPVNPYSTLRIIGHHVQFLTYLALPVVALLIALKSRSDNSLWLALALAAYSALGLVPLEGSLLNTIVLIAGSTLVGLLAIFAMQYFPLKIEEQQVSIVIKTRWLQRYLKFFLRPRNLWVGMMVILLLLSIAEAYLPFLEGAPSNLLILLTMLAYLYINFRLTTGVDHARILWLFWGLTMYILTTILYYVLHMYRSEPPGPDDTVRLLIAIASLLILFFSFTMSLFWADTFNTGVFVRRSAVNAILFLLVVFIYNTLEHYALHWVSHTLHISDAMVSSLLSGVLVLCINPLHHKLTGFLNRKLKKGQVETHHAS